MSIAADVPANVPTIALSSPQSLAATLPYLLGFHPEESLVCVWLHADQVLVVQRADLPAGAIDGSYVHAYFAPAANIRADEVIVVCVTRRNDMGEEAVRRATAHVDVPVRSALILRGSRIRRVGDEWLWVSSQDRLAAARHFRGVLDSVAVQRSRADVVREVDFDCEDSTVRESHRVAAAATTDLEALHAVLLQGRWSSVPARRAMQIGAATARGRDLIIWWCAASSDTKRRELLQALLAGLRMTPTGTAAELACAAAAVAWMCGDGVRSNAALDRCLEEDPENTMARMLESAMAIALPPSDFARMIADVPPDAVGIVDSSVGPEGGRRWGVMDD